MAMQDGYRFFFQMNDKTEHDERLEYTLQYRLHPTVLTILTLSESNAIGRTLIASSSTIRPIHEVRTSSVCALARSSRVLFFILS